MTKEEFAALCNQAREALADLKLAGEEYKDWYAQQHGVDPSQVQLFVTEGETKVEAVIRPQPKGTHRGW